jgi:negative regulator of replication initiation
MKTLEIEIDEDVYAAIERNAVGLNKKPNDVLRKLFNLATDDQKAMPSKNSTIGKSLDSFLQSSEYLRISTADEKYLCLVGWLFKNHSKLKESLDNYSFRTRILFSKNRKTIENSAENVVVKPIPEVDFFAMVTLDNRNKRKVISKVLEMAGYDASQIQRGLKTLPDSGVQRGMPRENIFAGFSAS